MSTTYMQTELDLSVSDLWVIDYECDLDEWVAQTDPTLYDAVLRADGIGEHSTPVSLIRTDYVGDRVRYELLTYVGDDMWLHDPWFGQLGYSIDWTEYYPDADCVEDSEGPAHVEFSSYPELVAFIATLCSETDADLLSALAHGSAEIAGPHCVLNLPGFHPDVYGFSYRAELSDPSRIVFWDGRDPFDYICDTSASAHRLRRRSYTRPLYRVFFDPIQTFWVSLWRVLFTHQREHDQYVGLVQFFVDLFYFLRSRYEFLDRTRTATPYQFRPSRAVAQWDSELDALFYPE